MVVSKLKFCYHLFGYMVIAQPILAQNGASAESNGLYQGVLGGPFPEHIVMMENYQGKA